MRLAQALTGPAIADKNMDPHYFSAPEMVLYVSILVCFAAITPGLRTQDLLPYAGTVYRQSEDKWAESILSLERFQEVYPPQIRALNVGVGRILSHVRERVQPNIRFGHFISLVHQTLHSGHLGITSSSELSITEGNAAVEPGDEIWVLFGCPTPMALRYKEPYFLAVAPVYIHDIMDGKAVEGVISPELGDPSGWKFVFATGFLGPEAERPYVSGKGNWLIRLISLC